jgi:hypothetical protein
VDQGIQDIFHLLREGAPLAREALKKIKDARVSASVESLETFVNDTTSRLLELGVIFQQKDDEIQKLKSELNRLRNWEDFTSTVQITEIDKGKFAWTLKQPVNETEAKLRYCTKCFEEQYKSILQMHQNFADIYTCPRCKLELKTPSTRPPTATGSPTPAWKKNSGY